MAAETFRKRSNLLLERVTEREMIQYDVWIAPEPVSDMQYINNASSWMEHITPLVY